MKFFRNEILEKKIGQRVQQEFDPIIEDMITNLKIEDIYNLLDVGKRLHMHGFNINISIEDIRKHSKVLKNHQTKNTIDDQKNNESNHICETKKEGSIIDVVAQKKAQPKENLEVEVGGEKIEDTFDN